MKASEMRIMFDVGMLWCESCTCSDPVRKIELEEARRKLVERYKRTSHYKAFVSSRSRVLQLPHTDQSIHFHASSRRTGLPRLAKADVDYAKDPYTWIDEEDFTDDENSATRKEEDEERLSADEDVSMEREEEPLDEDEDDISIVTRDHESEARRSETGEEALEVDNGSDLTSEGYPEEENISE